MFQFVQLKAPMIKALLKQIKYKNLIFQCFLFFFITFPFHTHCHFSPIVASGKAYSITFLKKLLEEKNQGKLVLVKAFTKAKLY